MPDTLFKEVNYSLTKLVEDIEAGEIGLPDLQRPFVWTNRQVRDLFDSMYRGFPVGYLLFWANGLSGEHRQIGTASTRHVPKLLIVDGQQRLTSLFAVLKGAPVYRDDFKREPIRIAFRPRDGRFEVSNVAIRRDPEWVADISELWSEGMTSYTYITGFLDRLRRQRDVDTAQEKVIAGALDRLFDIRNYRFTALELSASVPEEDVAEVFVRINSQGTNLNQADFILTLMSVFWEAGRIELERFCRDARQPSKTASPYNHFIEPDPDQLLRVSVARGFRRARLVHVYSILRGKDLETGAFSDERRERQFEVLAGAQADTLDLQHWHDFFKTVLRAGFRSRDMVSSANGLMYTYALYLIGRLDFKVGPDVLRETIARWFFMTQLTGRYTDSPETRMEQDVARLGEAAGPEGFLETLDRIVAETLTEDFWTITLPIELATSASRSPTLFAYYAALNLLGARVLFSNLKVSDLLDPTVKARRSAVERHHLFPRAYLQSIGITRRRDVNQIANFALVEWPDNAAIGAEPPSVYFPRYAHRLGSEDRYWHALPDGWHAMPYGEFLEARRKLMARVIHDGFARLGSGG